MTETQSQRLFVALWPEDEVRTKLSNKQLELNLGDYGRLVPATNLHITMLFLGDVPINEIPEIETFVKSIELTPFSFSISKIGFWPHNKIVWAGSEDTKAELEDLSNQIQIGLKRYVSDRRRFTPHVTLARKVRRRVQCALTPIEWRVGKVYLVRSVLSHKGSQYKLIASSGGSG